MGSRVDKYINSTDVDYLSRSNRNSKLYKQVYGKYKDLDNLPMTDNTDEIDMDKLKEILNVEDRKRQNYSNEHNLDILGTSKRNINDQKVYDINKLLEKAKYENNKLKEPQNKIINNSKSILSTLGEDELSINDIKKTVKKYELSTEDIPKELDNDREVTNLSMTREMKYHTRSISTDPMVKQVVSDNDLSLELLADLKPTSNTIVTKPITEELSTNKEESFFPTTANTSDINLIKENKKMDDDFFTSSYQFSENDFADDDFYDEKSHNILKIILLIVSIMAFVGVIFYFILNYGINS